MSEDIRLAKNYISKADNARSRGIEFNMSFTTYKNLMRAKKCKLTGVLLTTPRSGKELLSTDRTIDRLDSSKGYIRGNVAAISHAANHWKSHFECDNKVITPENGIKILKMMLDLKRKNSKVEEVRLVTAPQEPTVLS